MFGQLKRHWKVNSGQLFLILITFALGGSLCGWLGRKLLLWLHIASGWQWVCLYILLICLLWPLCVIAISILFGQFQFFEKYLERIWSKIRGRKKIRIAIFASGAGSNTQKIIDYFKLSASIKVELIVCNRKNAGVLGIAAKEHISSLLISRERFYNEDAYIPALYEHKIDFIVLAGFLLKVPEALVKAYPRKIINIHPALLPKYGGEGMYGDRVHTAVILNKEKESGISIHFVDELYDHGEIIFQARCPIAETDDANSLAKKIHQLEHAMYPSIIEQVIKHR
jgi:formyltetrahydrofolate-dependent phosphoribosylglycinamide formyltransferase